MTLLEFAICFFVSVADAASDAIMVRYFYVKRASPLDWTWIQWLWHVCKWLSFYPALIYIIYDWTFFEAAFTAFVCLLVWRVTYRLILLDQ